MKNTVLSIILCLSFSIACTQYEDISSCEQSEYLYLTTRSGAVVSDQNPYSLANVQEALDAIEGADAPELIATNLYVRFLPAEDICGVIIVA